MSWEIEMHPYSCVVIVSHSPSVLCAPVPAGPGRPYHSYILGAVLALARPVKAGHAVQHVVVPATDGLFDGPGFLCGTAAVCPCILDVDTAQTVCVLVSLL